jgi:hypothetical protein
MCSFCTIYLTHQNVGNPKPLGNIVRNVKPQMFLTHPTSKQHRAHLRKVFHFKFYIKRLPKSCRI